MVGMGHHGSHAERASAAVDDRGAGRVAGDCQGEQRACGSGAAGDGAAGCRGWADVCGGVRGGGVSQRRCGDLSGAAVQSGRTGGAGDRPWAGATLDLRCGGAGADRGDGAAGTGPEGGWDGDLVIEHTGADAAAGGAPSGGSDDDPSGAARRGQFVPADADVVPDRDGPTEAQGRGGAGGRSADGRKKGAIDQAYRLAEAAGLPVWCQDEAGPYQAIPQPGITWAPVGEPARLPHEYVRGGTAKLLTLFRPATGEVRATGVPTATNAVLHPWLQAELTAVLDALPSVTIPEGARPPLARWATWLGHEPRDPLPPLRLLLIWDNLAGHHSWAIVRWLLQHGVMPLYTPISGSWLNLAESIQRIIVRRALDGQHPQSQEELITWLDDTVAGWNADPTPFVWLGKRYERRQRARQRRLGGPPVAQPNLHSIAA
jgi:DDE superfamily endonuclease